MNAQALEILRRRWPWLAGGLLLVVALIVFATRPEAHAAYLVEARPLVQQVVATGRVISTSRSQVGSEIVATVLERHVREGDVVKPGQLLVTLRADDVEASVREAEAALQRLASSTRPEAQARLRQAEARRREELLTRQLVSRESMEQAQEQESVARAALDAARATAAAAQPGGTEEAQLRQRLAAARARLARSFIRAERAGVVLTRNVEPGDLVQPGRVLFEIAHEGATEIEVPVDEKNLAVLHEGQQAQCLADAWPDKSFVATVNYIAPGIDAERGTVVVRLHVEPVPQFLRQDMTVSVNVETGRRDRALAVPNDALLNNQSGSTVFVATDGRVSRRPVSLGLRGVAMTEVTDGLAEGDRVLADAASLDLADGARVRVQLQPAPATDSAPDTRRELPVSLD